MTSELALYQGLLADIKARVHHAQHRAALSANAEMVLMYWDVGRLIAARQQDEGRGTGVIPRLAVDLKKWKAVSQPRHPQPPPQFRHWRWQNWFRRQPAPGPRIACWLFPGPITSS
jgi:hypothetical protein